MLLSPNYKQYMSTVYVVTKGLAGKYLTDEVTVITF